MTEPPIHIEGTVGGDVVGGNKTVSLSAGDDIVGRDKITYEAPAIGVSALHQLPSPPADFTGRAAELAELRKAVREQGAAISGLRGLGGVGKTALALVLAQELAADYPDAQIFVNLQGVTDALTPEAVMAHVIRAYKPVEKLPDDPAQLAAVYRTVLTGQGALLLFDNARDAAQIRPLIPPPGCFLLVTSRQKFALPGLKAVNLDSLPPADAEALLLKLAARIGGAAGRLAELCGYLPLALTLAGSALAEREDLEPEQYARRLEQTRLTVLDEVEASLALSYELLSPELRRLWCLLSVFPADFDAPAAGAVWSLEAEAAGERLSDLLRFSLLDFNNESKRYRVHDLARDFARSKVIDAERNDAQRRHATYYRGVLAAANKLYLEGDEKTLVGLATFDLERVNFLAGQASATARSLFDETAAELASNYPDAGAYVLSLRQHPSEKIAWLEAGLTAARRLNNRGAEGARLGNLGLAYTDLAEPRRAIAYHEQALQVLREIGDRRGEGAALGNLGIAYRQLGEPSRAKEYYGQQLAIARETRDRRGAGNALGSLGVACATP
jgi:tetratricopeptide (TPR) repeat protein